MQKKKKHEQEQGSDDRFNRPSPPAPPYTGVAEKHTPDQGYGISEVEANNTPSTQHRSWHNVSPNTTPTPRFQTFFDSLSNSTIPVSPLSQPSPSEWADQNQHFSQFPPLPGVPEIGENPVGPAGPSANLDHHGPQQRNAAQPVPCYTVYRPPGLSLAPPQRPGEVADIPSISSVVNAGPAELQRDDTGLSTATGFSKCRDQCGYISPEDAMREGLHEQRGAGGFTGAGAHTDGDSSAPDAKGSDRGWERRGAVSGESPRDFQG